MVSIVNEEDDDHPQELEQEESKAAQIDESESSPLRSTENLSKDQRRSRSRGFSPLRSPKTPTHQPLPQSLSPVIVYNQSQSQSVHNDAPVVSKVDPAGFTHTREGDVEQGQKKPPPPTPAWREAMVNRALLGFRVCGVLFCLISFSVMAANKTRGWAGDSFDRYKEFRYSLSVSVIGFLYGGFQAVDLVRYLITTKHFIQSDLRNHFDFFIDQILAYLLMSASSAAASRVEDWESNWGKDEFTEMASASVGMSFLAFIAFAFCSLISGYKLCTHRHS